MSPQSPILNHTLIPRLIVTTLYVNHRTVQGVIDGDLQVGHFYFHWPWTNLLDWCLLSKLRYMYYSMQKVFCFNNYFSTSPCSIRVMAALLRNKYLHREIREKGGAYGGGAKTDSHGALTFYSYRLVILKLIICKV